MECTAAFSSNFTTRTAHSRARGRVSPRDRRDSPFNFAPLPRRARFWAGLYSTARTLRDLKACTTLGRKHCCASRNVTEAAVSSPTPFWILPRLRSPRHDAYERMTSRKCRAHGDTRRARHVTVAIFSAHDRRMPRRPLKRQVSPT